MYGERLEAYLGLGGSGAGLGSGGMADLEAIGIAVMMIYPHDGMIECELKRRRQERKRKRVQRDIDRRLAREVGIWHGDELVKVVR